MPAPKTASTHLKVRVREDLRARIEKAAKRNGVTLSQEIIGRLEQSFGESGLWLVRGDARAKAIYFNGDLLVQFNPDDVDGESGDIAILAVREPHRARFIDFFKIRKAEE